MDIPICSLDEYGNIINKEIIYKDKLFKLKNDLNITQIKNVGKYSLDCCIKTILDNNNTIFAYIQYSEKNKIVYFYTKDEIDTNIWQLKNEHIFNKVPLNSRYYISLEIRRLLKENQNLDSHLISLYDALVLANSKYCEFRVMKLYYDWAINNRFSTFESMEFIGFNYNDNEIYFTLNHFTGTKLFKFKKNSNNEIYISFSNDSYMSAMALKKAEDLISKFYDRLVDFRYFKEENKSTIYPVNSNFLAKINCNRVGISLAYPEYLTNNFNLEFEYAKKIFSCSPSLKLKRSISEELFKSILIKIDDCPEWMKKELYNIKQKQINQILESKNKIYL